MPLTTLRALPEDVKQRLKQFYEDVRAEGGLGHWTECLSERRLVDIADKIVRTAFLMERYHALLPDPLAKPASVEPRRS